MSVKPIHFIFIILLFFLSIPLFSFSLDYTLMEKIEARITGPFHLRLLIQPFVAVVFGVIDGKRDAKQGNPPFIFELFKDKKNRRMNLKNGLHTIWKPLLIGIVLDAIAQYVIFGFIRYLGAVLVGMILIGLPYSLSRGITNRLSSTS